MSKVGEGFTAIEWDFGKDLDSDFLSQISKNADYKAIWMANWGR